MYGKMSDSSEDEDLSRFREAVDTSFVKLIDESRGKSAKEAEPKQKSERYLETASHYNDVKVPEQMQKQIGDKVSAIIQKNVEFIDVQQNGAKKRKIKGGVRLFRSSGDYLSCDEAKDTYTEVHNRESKKVKNRRRLIDRDVDSLNEDEKINEVTLSGEYVLSKEETKCWKSRRKGKIYKYKTHGKSKVLTAIE